MKPVIVFDVKETLLDMAALDDIFGKIVPAGTSWSMSVSRRRYRACTPSAT